MTQDRLSLQVAAELDRLSPARDAPLGLAVSGGSDSLALLLMASDWARDRGARLSVATVDHGLRAAASGEAAEVAQACAALDIPCRILTLGLGQSDRRTPMAQARMARHVALADWAHQTGVTRLALGHTEDDLCETLLMRIRAGSGWYGLPGLARRSPSPAWPHGWGLTHVRPLLGQTRAGLQAWLASRNMRWTSDPTNDNPDYERTRVRRLVASLAAPSRASLVRSAGMLSRLRAIRNHQLYELAEGEVDWRENGSASLSRELILHGASTLARPPTPDLMSAMFGLVALCVSGQASRNSGPAIDTALSRIRQESEGALTLGNAWICWNAQIVTLYRRPAGEARSTGAPDLGDAPLVRRNGVVIWDNRIAFDPDEAGVMPPILHLEQARRSHPPPPRPPARQDDRATRTLPVFLCKDGTLKHPRNMRGIHRDRMAFLLRMEADQV